MSNRLAHETSPYLLQHAENPVQWYPWGPDALERSREEDLPIFLSVGYSACHWCHVMEHESFEDERIADLLNENFVCIKVDREERPDLDQIYMNAVQIMTGRGGWPMSVFLTPDLQPFFGGTYWPPSARTGMPGFDQVVLAVADAWKNRREQALESAAEITQRIQSLDQLPPTASSLSSNLLNAAQAKLERVFDAQHGGFGDAPKFPHGMDLQLLLRIGQRSDRSSAWDMVRRTLDKMAQGGIYDHLAGGFARYSVDARWLVPHFEKMLYDNALLAVCYLEAYQAMGEECYARVARETLDYVLKYMTGEQGGFHSAEDADSEGVEGKFYVWTLEEIEEVLGKEDAELFCAVYDVTQGGNFEGKNILNLPKSIEQFAALRQLDPQPLRERLDAMRARLLDVRDQRVRPGKDDKVLVNWNALMIDVLARAAGVLERPDYLAAAERAADFIWTQMRTPDGRLLHSWREGHAKHAGYLDDYTYLANALTSLYEASFEERRLEQALELTETLFAQFQDEEGGAFFYTADDHEALIARTKDFYDGSVPSGNAVAAQVLCRLGKLTGRRELLEGAEGILRHVVPLMEQSPTAAGQMLMALDFWLGPVSEIVLLGDPKHPDTQAVLTDLRRRFLPKQVVALRREAHPPGGCAALHPLFAGKERLGAEPTMFVCQDFQCQVPVAGKEPVRAALDSLFHGKP
jgi:uncharacterized protein